MKKCWWKEGVVYQIYPRSFYDSNGDGIGDLQGIIQKLDYLETLGIDIVWLCPVFDSPNKDNGYDIRDYTSILPEFGTITDMQNLIKELHQREMRLLLDMVVNHTSDQHRWFRQSRSSRTNQYRDYYIWRPGRNNGPPNNWESFFSGPAWTLDEATGEYYLHLFSKEQPDLNWDNPRVRDDIAAIMNWWADQGIDGFRLDVINLLSKTEGLPDSMAPISGSGITRVRGSEYYIDGPRIQEYLQELRSKVAAGRDVIAVGETPGVTPEKGLSYVDPCNGMLDLVFHFQHVDLDIGDDGYWSHKPWSLKEFRKVMTRWQERLYGKGWNSIYLGNHDHPRIVSRFGNDGVYRVESAKLLAVLLLTLGGTPFLYQGDELGMTNASFKSIEDYRDVSTRNYYCDALNAGLNEAEVLERIAYRSRDNSRTPVQWTAGPQGGFSTGEPWIGVPANHRFINVEESFQDTNSVLNFYRFLIRLRRHRRELVYGKYTELPTDNDAVYCYSRDLAEAVSIVILNFSDDIQSVSIPNPGTHHMNLSIGNYPVSPCTLLNGEDSYRLQPWEAAVYSTTTATH